MISNKIIEAVIKQAKQEDKDRMLARFITKLDEGYYYDNKINHCLELLLNEIKYITPDNIDMNYIRNNFSRYIYKSEEYIIEDIQLKSIDNIEGTVCIDYKYKAKINENRDDIDFSQSNVFISFIDEPEVLKKS